MFGLFNSLLPPTEPPQNVPPPTPISFPRYPPELLQDQQPPQQPQDQQRRKQRLTALLQSIVRPTDISLQHFQALGLHIHADADHASIIPDYHKHAPDFSVWNDTAYEEARTLNETTQRPLSNGSKSPGIQTYLDRRRELSTKNSTAFRTVRRMPPVPGQPPVRLGNAYEFFRNLENFSSFWDDTSMPPTPCKDDQKEKRLNESEDKGKKAPSEEDSADAAPAVSPAGLSRGEGEADIAERPRKSVAAAGDGGVDDGEGGGDGDSESSASSVAVSTDSDSKHSSPGKDAAPSTPEVRFYRTGSGTQMPPEYRLDLVTAFLKLVSYDFGCNVSPPRVEPRLYLNAGTVSPDEAEPSSPTSATTASEPSRTPSPLRTPTPTPIQDQSSIQPPAVETKVKKRKPSSYFSSGCIFVFRTPNTREAARAGIVEGPVAAVSARQTTSFSAGGNGVAPSSGNGRRGRRPSMDARIDLGRELVAALLTAQHRVREGRAERKLGKGEWWATKRRWGGGSGWPVGREMDVTENEDEASAVDSGSGGGEDQPARPGGGRALNRPIEMRRRPDGGPGGMAKRARYHGQSSQGGYLMVRPPSTSWDRKTRYMAIGRKKQPAAALARGHGYDDIFLVSALFHHISIVRVRVPQRLLRALDGDESDEEGGEGEEGGRGLEMVRSPWYDMFQVEDRLAALQLAWGMMAYLMRAEEVEEGEASEGGVNSQKKGKAETSRIRDAWRRPGGNSSK